MFVITKDTTYKAIYTSNSYTITVNVTGTGGTASSNVQSIGHGGNATITFSPAAGYEINTVTVNGSTVTVTGTSHTISNITSNTTVVVTYKIKKYTVKWLKEDGSTLKTETVDHGATVTPPTPDAIPGKTFDRWEVQ